MTLVVPLALAGGWWIFLIFVVATVFVVAFGYYTVRGSGIHQRPYRRPGEAPESPSELATTSPRRSATGSAAPTAADGTVAHRRSGTRLTRRSPTR